MVPTLVPPGGVFSIHMSTEEPESMSSSMSKSSSKSSAPSPSVEGRSSESDSSSSDSLSLSSPLTTGLGVFEEVLTRLASRSLSMRGEQMDDESPPLISVEPSWYEKPSVRKLLHETHLMSPIPLSNLNHVHKRSNGLVSTKR